MFLSSCKAQWWALIFHLATASLYGRISGPRKGHSVRTTSIYKSQYVWTLSGISCITQGHIETKGLGNAVGLLPRTFLCNVPSPVLKLNPCSHALLQRLNWPDPGLALLRGQQGSPPGFSSGSQWGSLLDQRGPWMKAGTAHCYLPGREAQSVALGGGCFLHIHLRELQDPPRTPSSTRGLVAKGVSQPPGIICER